MNTRDLLLGAIVALLVAVSLLGYTAHSSQGRIENALDAQTQLLQEKHRQMAQVHTTTWESTRGKETISTPRNTNESADDWQDRHDEAVAEAQSRWPKV